MKVDDNVLTEEAEVNDEIVQLCFNLSKESVYWRAGWMILDSFFFCSNYVNYVSLCEYSHCSNTHKTSIAEKETRKEKKKKVSKLHA
jgi:hypothetical protein